MRRNQESICPINHFQCLKIIKTFSVKYHLQKNVETEKVPFSDANIKSHPMQDFLENSA